MLLYYKFNMHLFVVCGKTVVSKGCVLSPATTSELPNRVALTRMPILAESPSATAPATASALCALPALPTIPHSTMLLSADNMRAIQQVLAICHIPARTSGQDRTPCPFKRYRGTSLIRNHHPVGPYSRTMPRLLWRSWGGGRFLMREVPL